LLFEGTMDYCLLQDKGHGPFECSTDMALRWRSRPRIIPETFSRTSQTETTRAPSLDILHDVTLSVNLLELIYIVPNAMISSGTSTTLHRMYSAMNFPRMSYVAFAVTPRSSQSCSRKCTAQIPGNSIRSMTWP
jgi:hypothetical protein